MKEKITQNNPETTKQNEIPEIRILSDEEILPPTSIHKIVSFLRYLSSNNKNKFSEYLQKLSVGESTFKKIGNLTEEERQKLEVFCEKYGKCKDNLDKNQVVLIGPNGYVKAVFDKEMSKNVISAYDLNKKDEAKEYYPMDVYVIPVKKLSFLTNNLEKMNKEIFKLDKNDLLVYNELSGMFYIVNGTTIRDGKVSSEHIKLKRNINDFPKQERIW